MVRVTGGGVGGSISGLLPVQLRRLEAEEREPRADAAGGVVEDAVLAATHTRRGMVPEALLWLAVEVWGWGQDSYPSTQPPEPEPRP